MAEDNRGKQSNRNGLFGPGIRAGKLAGVVIVLDWSLLIIFALIAINLGVGVFPAWHPDWSPLLVWSVALAAAALLFVSVLVHELSHAIVARAHGVSIERITLFMFGGMAHMRGEATSPRAEFLIAGVGPLTSFLIGVVATTAGLTLAGPDLTRAEDPLAAYQQLGPAATLLLWLGPINVILAIFNLVPGFPLDGGRLLRALLWWITGSIEKATRWAAGVGRGFGWLLVGTGILMVLGVSVPIFGTGALGGFWLILIGWFLSMAARASYQQLVFRQALADVQVDRLMYSALDRVPPDLDLDKLVHEHMMRSEQRCFPVVEGKRFVGLVCLDDVRKVPRTAWDQTSAQVVMTPAEKLSTLSPTDDAAEAMQELAEQNYDQLPVVERGELKGLVRRQDIMRWLALRGADRRRPAR